LTGHCVYAAPEFAAIWRAMGGVEVFLVHESDGRFEAGLSGVIFGGGRLRRFQSMPDGLPGGMYFPPDSNLDDRESFAESVMAWIRRNRIIRADINNPAEDFGVPKFTRHETTTHIIDLKGETFAPPRREVRKQIRAARRREARITTMNDDKYLDRFYDLVIATEERHHQKPRYSREFFAGLLEASLHDERIKWFIALVDEKIIGYHICFVGANELMTWQYYSDKKFTRLKPGYLLLDYIINYALENNIKTINMGYSPPDAASLVDFKERWGGRKQTCRYYTYFSPLGRLLYRWRK